MIEALRSIPPASLAAVLLGIVAMVLVIAAFLIQAARHRRRDLREIVRAVEELRSGRMGRPVEVDPRSPTVLVADALNRLGQEIPARWGDLEVASEELRAVLDAARDYGVIATDVDGDVRSFSAGASAIFGWDEASVVGRSAAVLFDEASWKDLLPKFTRREIRDRGVETRSVLVRMDGSRFQARLSIRPLRRGASRVAGYLVVVRDVSAEARLEADLRETETRYRRLVEGMVEGVAIVRDGKIVYANPSLAALLGREATELEATPVRDSVATRDVLHVQAALDRLERAGEGATERFVVGLRDAGGITRATARVQAVTVSHGGTTAVLLTVLDETAERRAYAVLRENEARLDAVLESTSDGLLLLDATPAGRVVRLANAAFAELVGIGRDEILGLREEDLVERLRDPRTGAAAIADALSSPGGATAIERATVTLEGARPRIVDVSLVDLAGSGAGGRVLGCRDVTDQKSVERELAANAERLARSQAELEEAFARLKSVHDDLGRRSEDLHRLNRELRTLDEMKSELLANVSHELQTPLVSIRGYTEMILKGRLGSVNEEQRKGLALSLRNIDRLIGMIDNLLAFARTPRDAGEIRISSFPLMPVVDEATELLRERRLSRGVTFEKSFEDPDLVVRGDRDKILQVFVNLLSNAVKFNRDGGHVAVEVGAAKPGFVRVQVRDTGVGIGPEDLDRIFERHYQAASAGERASDGSGIGLSIVRDILRLHGCVIQVASRLGEGTTFSFNLPLVDQPAGGDSGGALPGGETEPTTGGDPEPDRPVPPLPRAAAVPAMTERPRLRIIRPTGGRS